MKILVIPFFAVFLVFFSAELINCGGLPTNLSKSNEKPIFIQAGDLIKEYRENQAAADEKYKGKLLAVKGEISGILKSLGYVWIAVRGSGNFSSSDPDPKGIGCVFGEPDKVDTDKINLHQEVTIVGENDGMKPAKMMRDGEYITLQNCRIGENPESDEPNSNKTTKSSLIGAVLSETPLPDASTGKLPADDEIQGMLRKTMQDLADAIEKEDFTEFKARNISKGAIAYRVTPERIKMFYGHKMMLPYLRLNIGIKPTFSRKPSITRYTMGEVGKTPDVYSALNLNGFYENGNQSLNFEVQYLAEGKDWKVSVFNFSPKQGADNNIPPILDSGWEIVAGRSYGRFHQSGESFTVRSSGEIRYSDKEKGNPISRQADAERIKEINEMLTLLDLPAAKKIPDDKYNACIISLHLPSVYFTLKQNGKPCNLTHCNSVTEKSEYQYTLILSVDKRKTYEALRQKLFRFLTKYGENS